MSFFDAEHYRCAAEHLKKYLSEVDDGNSNKPWALYLLAECYQLKSKKKPSKAVSFYRETIDLLLKNQAVELVPNRPSKQEVVESHNQNQNNENGLVHQDVSSENRSAAQEDNIMGLVLDDGSVIDSTGNRLSAER